MKRKEEKLSSGRKSLRYRGTKCLNCEHTLDKSDVYCPNCSQLNSDKQLSAKDFFGEFLSSILVYDSRLRKTLNDLLFRPGKITKNYVAGQRLKYANPFRFFLSVSIIYFLLESLGGFIESPDHPRAINFQAPSEISIDSLSNLRPPEFKSLSTAEEFEKAEKLGISQYYTENTLDSLPTFDSYTKRSNIYYSYYYKTKTENSNIALDSLNHTNIFKNRWLYSRAISLYKITHNTDDFIKYISTKFPFFLFFFVPFYALFFWLLYSKKEYTYMEHVIFVFHIFSFIFLALLIFKIPDIMLGFDLFQSILFFALGPLYFYSALRKFYNQGKWRTLFKFVFLSIIFFMSFIIAIGLFVAASAAIY